MASELLAMPMVDHTAVAKVKLKQKSQDITEYRLWATVSVDGRYYSVMAVSSPERRQVFDDALPAAVRQQVSDVVAMIRRSV